MNKDQIKGRTKQAKGEVKQVIGKLVGDKSLETKGAIQKAAGKIQNTYGKAKEGALGLSHDSHAADVD